MHSNSARWCCRGLVPVALAFLLNTGCATAQHPRSEAATEFLRSQMSAQGIPGLAAAVIQGGRPQVWFVGGVASVESGTPVSATTRFQVASTVKVISSTIALQLVTEGRWRLDDPIGSVLEDLPAAWQPVTIRQLLSHTSGLPDVAVAMGRAELIAQTWEEAFAKIAAASVNPPGERWAYNQTNYVLLRLAIERLEGKPWAQVVNDRVLQPAGMSSVIGDADSNVPNAAINYGRPAEDGTVSVQPLRFPPYVRAAGGFYASLEDMVAWDAALRERSLLPPAAYEQLWSPVRLNDGAIFRLDGRSIGYGLGWVVNERGARALGHSGGGTAAYYHYPDLDVSVIVLHNGQHNPDALVAGLIEALGY